MSGVCNLRALHRPAAHVSYLCEDWSIESPSAKAAQTIFVLLRLWPAYDSQLESVYAELSNVTNKMKNDTRLILTFQLMKTVYKL